MSEHTDIATVFGGHGFLGRHLVWKLARRGTTIRIAARDPDKASFLKTAGAVGQILPWPVDLADDHSVARAVDGATLVVNLVGILYESRGSSFQALHAEAPGRIARAAAATGARRMAQVSAIGADPRAPAEYARTKAAGEQAVLAAFPDATILRPSIVFGPEDNFFNQFAQMAMIAPALPLIGGGTSRFQPVYVGDVADAILAALDRPDATGKIYELGGPEVLTFRQCLTRMLAEIRRSRLLVPIPWAIAGLQARVLEKLPKPLLTRDQLAMLKTDNVVTPGMPGLVDLGVSPTPLDVILPTYLDRFRPGGVRHAPAQPHA